MTRPVRRFPKSRGSNRVVSGQEIARILTGRSGSGQDVFESHGSVRVTQTRPDPTRPAGGGPTREKPCYILSSDKRYTRSVDAVATEIESPCTVKQ